MPADNADTRPIANAIDQPSVVVRIASWRRAFDETNEDLIIDGYPVPCESSSPAG